MADNYNYPLGADADPRAPWNQSDQEPLDVNVTISQTLHRDAIIGTVDYTEEVWEDVEYDENGSHRFGGISYDFSSCNLDKDYSNQEYDIPKLLQALQELVKEKLEREGNNLSPYEKSDLEQILKASSEWVLDESEVIRN